VVHSDRPKHAYLSLMLSFSHVLRALALSLLCVGDSHGRDDAAAGTSCGHCTALKNNAMIVRELKKKKILTFFHDITLNWTVRVQSGST
jgi:hypothetical protein